MHFLLLLVCTAILGFNVLPLSYRIKIKGKARS